MSSLRPSLISFALCLILLVFIAVVIHRAQLVYQVTKTLPYAGIHVQGNHFVDQEGNSIVLHGASRWSLEFSCGDGHFSLKDFQAMKSWGMNIVRLPLNERYFLEPSLCSDNYQTTVFAAIQNAKTAGLSVLLDLHWVYPQGVAKDPRGGQFPMPDDNALVVWKILAQKYKDDPKIFFEFMNEPHDVSCNILKNGGTVTSPGNTTWINQTQGTYHTPGLQKFVDTVRSLGANNMIIQGISSEADLSCADKMPLVDPIKNLTYQAHFYGTDPQGSWQTTFAKLIRTYPIIAGEFDQRQALSVPTFFENQLQTGYLFWPWNTGSTIKNFSGEPLNPLWQSVRDIMQSSVQ